MQHNLSAHRGQKRENEQARSLLRGLGGQFSGTVPASKAVGPGRCRQSDSPAYAHEQHSNCITYRCTARYVSGHGEYVSRRCRWQRNRPRATIGTWMARACWVRAMHKKTRHICVRSPYWRALPRQIPSNARRDQSCSSNGTMTRHDITDVHQRLPAITEMHLNEQHRVRLRSSTDGRVRIWVSHAAQRRSRAEYGGAAPCAPCKQTGNTKAKVNVEAEPLVPR